jgi:hypothetical protein
MTEQEQILTKEKLLTNLEVDWKEYPLRINSLPPDLKAKFLFEQGYSSAHDLLAHIIAWWQEALKVINSIMDLNEVPRREYDEDAFNAEAIALFRAWKEDDLLTHYENLRLALINLLADLPEDGLKNQRICGWLNAVLVEHFKTHDCPR